MSITLVCDGKQHSFGREAEEGEPHATLQTLATSPGWSTLSSWFTGTLKALDPRPRRLAALAFEIIRVADSEASLVEPGPPAVDPEAPPVRSSLRLGLVGTLIATGPEPSIASIQDCLTLKTQTYSVGDVVQGAELLSIERRQVIVKHSDRREFLAGPCERSPDPSF
ncbi:MAG: hypothetical protein JNJ54_01875 [Myxococcaceae bacterium]|nr:hypothetical protein [Myxococcaceae bacterium]